MKRVRVSITILDTIDFDDDMTEEAIDSYIDFTQDQLQRVLDKAEFGCVNDVEYSIEEIDDEEDEDIWW